MARRLSHGGAQFSNKVLEDGLKVFMERIESAADRVKENTEEMEVNNIKTWETAILTLVTEGAKLKNQMDATKSALTTILGGRVR